MAGDNALWRVKTERRGLCDAHMLDGIFNVWGSSEVEELAFRQAKGGKWSSYLFKLHYTLRRAMLMQTRQSELVFSKIKLKRLV